MSDVTIYYNPSCSKCRQTKTLLEENQINAKVIEYLRTSPSKEDLIHIISQGIPAKELVRTHEDAWKELNIDINSVSDDEIIDALVKAPGALQRPIVIANGKATLGRPPEKVLDIL